jgi:hypothetical protein
MGLMSFIKEAGEKLFGKGEAKAAEAAVASDPSPENVAALSKAAGDAIATYIGTQGLQVDGLDVGFDAPTSTVTVSGSVADQATKDRRVASQMLGRISAAPPGVVPAGPLAEHQPAGDAGVHRRQVEQQARCAPRPARAA